MKRGFLLLLLLNFPALAEEPKPPDEAAVQAAARQVADEQEFVRDSARKVILAVGTAALPALRAELKQVSNARSLSRLASVIELLEVTPRERKVRDSLGPFALGADGAEFATYATADSVLVNSGRSAHYLDPGAGDTQGQPRRPGIPVERPLPVFLGPKCIAISKRSCLDLALFEPESGGSLGSLVLKTPEGKFASSLQSILRLDDIRFVTVRGGTLWVQSPLGDQRELTVGFSPRILAAAAQDRGVVALFAEPHPEISLWDAHTLKLMKVSAAPLDNTDLMHAARKDKAVAVGSSATAEIAVSTSDSLEFGKARASGFGPNGLSALAVSPDGAWVAMGSPDGAVRIRLATTWEQLVELNPGGKVAQLEFSDDGATLGVQAGEKLQLYGVRYR